nr:PepSY domain-containing protein [Novosphingobium acidiphilum]
MPARAYDPQHEARRAVRTGSAYRLRDIERRILPTMPGMQYLGPEYDDEAMAYRLKFIRDGRVTFVDVDARTGQVRGRSH